MSTEKVVRLFPALISGVVGAGLALLLTPKSGKEIRQDLGRLAKRAGAEAGEGIQEGKSVLNEAVRTGQESIAESKEQFAEMTAGEEAKSSLLVPILVSGIVGASLALLFAPNPGRKSWKTSRTLRQPQLTRARTFTIRASPR